jgi:hypothetical protein
VLAAESLAGLGELLRFRHVVRHLYAYELDPPQVGRLLAAVPGLWRGVEERLVAFEAWLAELALQR